MAVFSFYAKLCFSFLPFLNLGAQISCPENPYPDLKPPLDQPVSKAPKVAASESLHICIKVRFFVALLPKVG